MSHACSAMGLHLNARDTGLIDLFVTERVFSAEANINANVFTYISFVNRIHTKAHAEKKLSLVIF